MDTTVSKVRAIANHLEVLDDSTIEMYIDDAKSELDSIPDDKQERLQRYLAAHYATLNIRRPDSEQIGNDINTQYNADHGEGLARTEYGQEVDRILKKLTGPNLRLLS